MPNSLSEGVINRLEADERGLDQAIDNYIVAKVSSRFDAAKNDLNVRAAAAKQMAALEKKVTAIRTEELRADHAANIEAVESDTVASFACKVKRSILAAINPLLRLSEQQKPKAAAGGEVEPLKLAAPEKTAPAKRIKKTK